MVGTQDSRVLTHVGTRLLRVQAEKRASRTRSRSPYCWAVAELHDTTEEYLETILSLEEEGVVPMRARLVERLGLSAAAVSETVGRLVDGGWVPLEGDPRLRLPPKGPGLATTARRRHPPSPALPRAA